MCGHRASYLEVHDLIAILRVNTEDIAILYLERCSVRWCDRFPGAEAESVRACVNYSNVSSLPTHHISL